VVCECVWCECGVLCDVSVCVWCECVCVVCVWCVCVVCECVLIWLRAAAAQVSGV